MIEDIRVHGAFSYNELIHAGSLRRAEGISTTLVEVPFFLQSVRFFRLLLLLVRSFNAYKQKDTMMIEAEALITFFAASVLLGLAPGPDNIFVMTQSALYGKKAGIAVMSGQCTGLIVHTAAVALGVAVIFQTSALAFSVLKYTGAAYLVYLAWQAFMTPAETVHDESVGKFRLWKLYRRGIFMSITNPKVSLFFLAFLPQFVDPSAGAVPLQILILGGVFIIATILVFGSIALLAGSIAQLFSRSGQFQKILNRIAGTVFLGLALKIATTER